VCQLKDVLLFRNDIVQNHDTVRGSLALKDDEHFLNGSVRELYERPTHERTFNCELIENYTISKLSIDIDRNKHLYEHRRQFNLDVIESQVEYR